MRDLSANDVARALISMMVRSDDELQSETGYIDARPHQPDRRNPLAPHGRTIHLGQSRTFGAARSMSEFEVQGGKHILVPNSSQFDPNVWSGRAVQEVFVDSAVTVSHQCIRPLIGACAPGHHGYQRACDLISGQASTGPFGSPVFARAGKTDPPSSSHPLADLGGQTKLGHR